MANSEKYTIEHCDGIMFGAFTSILIPLLRRAIPSMVAFNICGVQPMQQPSGLIFALKASYDCISKYDDMVL